MCSVLSFDGFQITTMCVLRHDNTPHNHAQVEKLFRQSAEFCSEHEVWKLNVAHVFFMQVCVCV